MKKRVILFSISLGLLAALIYFSNPGKVFDALLQAKPSYIALGLLFWLFGTFLRSYRWKYLLQKADVVVDYQTVWKFYVSGLFLSNLTPAKSGDPVRALLLKKGESKSFSKSLSSIFVERILDVIVLISISVTGLFMLALLLEMSIWWVYLAIGIYSAGVILGIFVLLSKERTQRVAGKLVSIFSFIDKVKDLEGRIGGFSEKISSSFKKYKDKKVLINGLILSYGVWFLNAIVIFMAFRAVGVLIPVQIVLAVMTTSLLLSILTFLPGALGSGDIISVTLYLGLLDYPLRLLTTGKILSRFLNWWMYAVVGAILLLIFLKNVDIEEGLGLSKS